MRCIRKKEKELRNVKDKSEDSEEKGKERLKYKVKVKSLRKKERELRNLKSESRDSMEKGKAN